LTVVRVDGEIVVALVVVAVVPIVVERGVAAVRVLDSFDDSVDDRVAIVVTRVPNRTEIVIASRARKRLLNINKAGLSTERL
jgi:ABC-type enterochelin transport system permease subunit